MKIYLKTLCQEVFGKLPDGEYEVPEGCDARCALLSCIDQYGGDDVLHSCIDHIIYMCNGKHISPETVLCDNDRLMVLRPVRGG